MRIGILALQGAFAEHKRALSALGASSFEIRQLRDLETGRESGMDGLIIPGGESTVIGKLMRELGMFDKIKRYIEVGLPVFGTCAGLLLLADSIRDEGTHLRTMSITAVRNAYGRQLGSFRAEGGFGELKNVPMTFIRAPYIESAAEGVEILAVADGKIVAARQDRQLVTAFHPELGSDLRVHGYFLDMIRREE